LGLATFTIANPQVNNNDSLRSWIGNFGMLAQAVIAA